ncbi:MAG: DUF4912 domain-containing protein, partial [Cyanobacteria bacterium REEB65]|nr:DUF4912 domain-containing protein [Cyanobacteria bacterium REEB65]
MEEDKPESPATEAVAKAFKQTTQDPDLLAVDAELGELPAGYDEDRAVLLVRDPYWVYTYWDLAKATLKTAESRGDFRQILRVQEVGGFGQTEPAYFYDVPVPKAVRSWYLRLPGDGRRYQVEVALQHRDGTYTPVARTNAVEAPKSEPSELV